MIHPSLYAIASKSAIYLWDLDVSCDGKLLMAGAADGIIRYSSIQIITNRVWRTSSFSEPFTLTTNQNDLYSITAHPLIPQFILSGGFNGTVELWNSETSRILKVRNRVFFLFAAIFTSFQFCFCYHGKSRGEFSDIRRKGSSTCCLGLGEPL